MFVLSVAPLSCCVSVPYRRVGFAALVGSPRLGVPLGAHPTPQPTTPPSRCVSLRFLQVSACCVPSLSVCSCAPSLLVSTFYALPLGAHPMPRPTTPPSRCVSLPFSQVCVSFISLSSVLLLCCVSMPSRWIGTSA